MQNACTGYEIIIISFSSYTLGHFFVGTGVQGKAKNQCYPRVYCCINGFYSNCYIPWYTSNLQFITTNRYN